MHIETKAYKFNATKKEVRDRIARLGEDSALTGHWIDENNFHLQKVNSIFFKLEGNINELESHRKIKITVSSRKNYLLFYLLPVAIIIFGLFQMQVDKEIGWILVLGGISSAVFIYLVAFAIIGKLKISFKEEFQLI